MTFCQFNRPEGFGQGTDLIHFNQNRIADFLVNTHLQALRVGYKQIVANQLHFIAQLLGQGSPALPVVFCQTVFDRDDRIFFYQFCQVIDHLGAGLRRAFRQHMVFAVFVELAGRYVHCQHNILTRFVAGFFNGFHDYIQRFRIGFQIRGKAAFVAQTGAEPFVFQDAFQGMVNFYVHAQAFAEVSGAHRHDHKFLDIHVVIRMLAAVQDIHHGNRQFVRIGTAQILVQRQSYIVGRCLGNCHGYA